jgi:putative peptide maturation dehydrogenase
VLCDSGDGSLRDYAEREEKLRESAWHPISAIHHFCTKWRDVHLNVHVASDVIEVAQTDEDRAAVFDTFIDTYGMPPAHFSESPNLSAGIELPFEKEDSELYNVLTRRRTSRIFDQNRKLSRSELGKLCRYSFGPFGMFEAHPGIFGLGKTSPSGGGLHPTNIYVLVLRAEDLNPGIYFYDQEHHSLRLVVEMSIDEAMEQANVLSAGQQYPRTAAALFLLTSRFYRNYWKYRKHPKAYAVLHMDLAHLSQTFYLVCEKLGLGAFFTAAVNSGNIEAILGLDPYEEGALAILGCGAASREQLGLRVDFEPFSAI